ncbi:VWA domain-containing protein [Simiduia agarivorans]|uniref:von Willebrand factor A n=1 Tax=Simiduia agarivorans (strain DSM 21679 / JCM 13881 / BCRC 17597 / SA1) TaxID=1117647 RepID=K4KRN6_SIMAS|nr:vWA domain-containing protein [Simiduia agarivorans]AFV00814.1 von Willebrand factor A [Simiduia agarivorans SA1 = DSM 21679]
MWRRLLCLFVACTWLAGAEAEVQAEKADVRVIIDISGSMKQNDPENLRRPALDLLIKMIPEGSKAGVWTFGQYVNMLVPHRDVDAEWRREAAAKVEKVNSVGLFTNIGGALERATKDGGKPLPGYRTNIILLTDGMVDIDREPAVNQKEWRRIVDEVLPSLQGEQIKIHTVALSANADKELMNALSLGTDGIVAVAENADELMRIFLRMLEQSAPADEVPLSENKFLVDSSIEEFTALIFRADPAQQAQLLAPDKSFYQADTKDKYLSWHRGADHDLITIKHPIEGEWLVRADLDPDSKITVVTDLKLLVNPLPNNLFVNQGAELQFLLKEKGKTVSDARFLRLLKVQATLTDKRGNSLWDKNFSDALPPGDGIYRATLPAFDKEVMAQLTLRIDGKSFNREFSHRFAVREPFRVELVSSDAGAHTVKVSANGQSLDRSRTVVVAKVREPNGRSSIQPLVLSATDHWELALSPELDGEYQVDLRISAYDKDGNEFEHHPDTLRFSHPTGQPLFSAQTPAEPEPVPEATPTPAEPEPVVEPEPEPEPESEPEGLPAWIIYTGLGVGNLLIMVLAWVAYRTIMGGRKVADADVEALEQEDELEAQVDEAAPANTAPKLEDFGGEDDDPPPKPAMDPGAEVDLESDEAVDSVAEASDPPLDEEDAAPEFSLDDLAPAKDEDEKP